MAAAEKAAAAAAVENSAGAGEDVLKGKKCTLDELVLLKIIKQEQRDAQG